LIFMAFNFLLIDSMVVETSLISERILLYIFSGLGDVGLVGSGWSPTMAFFGLLGLRRFSSSMTLLIL
jgi:hypothetical protein